MKKKKLKSLRLNKKSISNLEKGQPKGGKVIRTLIDNCASNNNYCGSAVDNCPSFYGCTILFCPILTIAADCWE